jgi:kumamolisin
MNEAVVRPEWAASEQRSRLRQKEGKNLAMERPNQKTPGVQYVSIPNSELVHAPGARSVPGRVNLGEVAEVALFVRGPSSGSDLEAHVQAQGSLRASRRQHLTRADLAEKYGADKTDLDAISRFASDAGLTVTAISPAQRIVRLAGPLSSFAEAFQVQFGTYQSPQGSYRGYTGTVQVPASISSIVKAVIGLDNKPQSQYHLKKLPSGRQPMGASAAAMAGTQSYTPNQVAGLYNFPKGVDGTGQCVGILEFGGGYKTADLNTYFQSLGITSPQIVSVSVNGAVNQPQPGPNSPDDEVMLDVEVVGCIASGALIVVYFAPNTTLGWLRAVSTAVNDSFHNPSVISISWGGPESSWSRGALEMMNYEFQSAAALGVTICTAAGDQGYTDGVPGTRAHVDFPASSPYVVACGGTRLNSSGSTITAESVWNDSPGSATGGGVSAVFPVPSYQSNANVPPSVNPPNLPGRGVPDVSGDADPNTGYVIRVDGRNEIIGGTSAVAPLWAALLTLINQSVGSPLGFVNPMLYSQGLAGVGFNDIVNGNNGAGGYHAGPGWDACSGLGTPDGTKLAGVL